MLKTCVRSWLVNSSVERVEGRGREGKGREGKGGER
jgi:hypothetical protein